MKFLNCTALSGENIWINFDRVAYMSSLGEEGTQVLFECNNESEALQVKETCEDILDRINEK